MTHGSQSWLAGPRGPVVPSVGSHPVFASRRSSFRGKAMARTRQPTYQGSGEPEDESQEVPDVEAMREMPHPPPPRKRPIHVVRFGKIQAAIWENWSSELGLTVYNVTVSRSYRDGDGQWQSSNS